MSERPNDIGALAKKGLKMIIGQPRDSVSKALLQAQTSIVSERTMTVPTSGWSPAVYYADLMTVFLILMQCLTVGCAESSQGRARRLESILTQAGFRAVAANTPARESKLAEMTPLKLNYFTRNGKASYWFADPYVCHCLYVGDEQNYKQFEQVEQERAEEFAQQTDERNYNEFMASPAAEVFYGE
jgi:hypothetical protein